MAEDGQSKGDELLINAYDRRFLCGVVEGFYGRPWTPEQRRDLFVKMKKFGLNTYMYAPKDDFKHRAYWRELYSVEEAEHLRSLVQAAKENDVIFYYAISPGLDITYSSQKDVSALKRKLDQVAHFGCEAFALLFDDIEPEISETDKEVFLSCASAQAAIANEIFEHFSHPRFIFCPTEYCAARAVPNVQNSEYLGTIGFQLNRLIDIMWTGPKVISKEITVESVRELSEVLRREPLIWDNLHANDYDQKRLFLGPYCGRSTELIPHIRGILTNPNCEYETNFIPIHTLSQWSKCNLDLDHKKRNPLFYAGVDLETENESGSIEDIPAQINAKTYHPPNALLTAVAEWHSEFFKTKDAFGRILETPIETPPVQAIPRPVITSVYSTAADSAEPSDISGAKVELDLPYQAPLNETESMLSLTSTVSSTEPMDCNPALSPPKLAIAAIEEETTEGISKTTGTEPDVLKNDSPEEMQTEPVDISSTSTDCKNLLESDITLLVDLFYLPFEHGRQGIKFLQEFHWLKTNGYLIAQRNRKKSNNSDNPDVEEWFNRAAKFDRMTQAVGTLLSRLTNCSNRSLVYDLYPYIWDIKGVISMLNSYLKWIALRRIPTPVSGIMAPPFTGYKETYMSGEQEPWAFLGGLTAELQHLLPLESVNDLYLYKSPDVPNNKIYTIRPYLPSDERLVYEVCIRTCDDGMDGSDWFPDFPDLIGDKLVGHFLCLSPEYCFVVEDENGVCGYALAALDAQQHRKKSEMCWIPKLLSKYPLPKKTGTMLSPAEEIIAGFHNRKLGPPDIVYQHHPSHLRMSMLPTVSDSSVPKRMLTCILSTLKANGSHGVFSDIVVGDKNVVEFFTKLGFMEIAHPGFTCEDVFYMGRTF